MTRIRNIKELAELAKVSTGTVSRALAGSDLISKATRERIQGLAAEHGFRPNIMARNLRIRRTGAIGVLIPPRDEQGQHLSEPFVAALLGLLADALTERGYDLLLSRIIASDEKWLDRFVDSGRTDGVIVIGQTSRSATLDRVAQRYHPLVVWGGHAPRQHYCTVGSDNRRGGYLAAQHLIERGCRRIAFLGDDTADEIRQRLDGCSEAMAAAGMADRLTIVPARFGPGAPNAEISRLLGTATDQPQGIVAASDVIAMKALSLLSEQGVAVPEDVRVIGFDGLTLGEQTVPRLSTISQGVEKGAVHLVDVLLRRIAGESTHPVIMVPELVVRMSS